MRMNYVTKAVTSTRNCLRQLLRGFKVKFASAGGGRGGLNDNRCEHMLFMSRGETFKKEEPPSLGIKYAHGGR